MVARANMTGDLCGKISFGHQRYHFNQKMLIVKTPSALPFWQAGRMLGQILHLIRLKRSPPKKVVVEIARLGILGIDKGEIVAGSQWHRTYQSQQIFSDQFISLHVSSV